MINSISKLSARKVVYLTAAVISFLFVACVESSFAKEAENKAFVSGKELTELEKQARAYREEGVKFQNAGDLDLAVKMYEKAVELDPVYAVSYNDLGIIFETGGFTDIAVMNYLKAIKVDPDYLSAYSNLALLYENQRDLEKAAFYWGKRAQLGAPDDPWTQKAKQRIRDIEMAQGKSPFRESREQEVVSLLKDVEAQKPSLKKSSKEQAQVNFKKAILCQKRGDDVTALKLAIDASYFDPSNPEIEEFINKTQTKLLSK